MENYRIETKEKEPRVHWHVLRQFTYGASARGLEIACRWHLIAPCSTDIHEVTCGFCMRLFITHRKKDALRERHGVTRILSTVEALAFELTREADMRRWVQEWRESLERRGHDGP